MIQISRSVAINGATKTASQRFFSMASRNSNTNSISRAVFSAKYNSPRHIATGIQFARYLSTEMEQSISEAVKSAPVVLFMKGTPEAPACGFSRSTIALLGSIGVDPEKFAAYNVLEDAELRQGIKEYSDWPTIPQLYVNGEFIGGCDIVTSMAQNGELLELLEKEGLLVYEEEEQDIEEPQSTNVKPVQR